MFPVNDTTKVADFTPSLGHFHRLQEIKTDIRIGRQRSRIFGDRIKSISGRFAEISLSSAISLGSPTPMFCKGLPEDRSGLPKGLLWGMATISFGCSFSLPNGIFLFQFLGDVLFLLLLSPEVSLFC